MAAVLVSILTQHWITQREFRNQLLKEKRDAFVGAFEAENAYWKANRQSRWLTDRYGALDRQWNDLYKSQDHYLSIIKDESSSEANVDDAKAALRAISKELERVRDERRLTGQQCVDAENTLNSSILDLFYWLARVELYCSSDSAKALKEMYGDVMATRSPQEEAFIEAARRDLLERKKNQLVKLAMPIPRRNRTSSRSGTSTI
jgi:hypothetical protein